MAHDIHTLALTDLAAHALKFFAGLVYPDPFVLLNGSSLEDKLPPERYEANPNRVVEKAWGYRMPPLANNLRRIVDPVDQKWVASRIVDQSFKTMMLSLNHDQPWWRFDNLIYALVTEFQGTSFKIFGDLLRDNPPRSCH